MYLLLTLASSLLNVFYKMRYRRTKIYHKVGQLHFLNHKFVELHVGFKVAVANISLRIVVGGKYEDTLMESAVLNYRMVSLRYSKHIFETFFQEVDLHGKRPSLDVFIIVFHIGILHDSLVSRIPFVMLGKHLGKRCFSASDISCNSYIHVVIFKFKIIIM